MAVLQGKFGKALMHYQRVYKMDPSSGEALFGMERTLTDENKPDQALKYLRMAVQTDVMNASAHYTLTCVCHDFHPD